MIARSAKRLGEALAHSPSQLGQDLFVLSQLNWKRGGYYVEFGAADGHAFSNTWLLDRKYGWRGILAEPARGWPDALQAQDRNAELEFDCVWSATGETLTVSETAEAEYSTLSSFRNHDHNDRSNATTYEVSTISLMDLLAKHSAPALIDYLSIDTEGSELAIPAAFDFGRYRFRCITCEPNFTGDRKQIHALMTTHGYQRVLEEYSAFDGWYVGKR